MESSIFEEIENWGSLHKISILQYDNTIEFGNTFAMTFIAMSAKLWRKLVPQARSRKLCWEPYGYQIAECYNGPGMINMRCA
jgi:hypothetical protein